MEEMGQAYAPSRFTPGGIYPSVRWIGGWMDTKAGLGPLEKNKFIIYVAFKPRTVYHVA
jgi:hypothetical protein